jgi:hypothetical protein
MSSNVICAAICGVISALMFMADVAWTPFLGAIFGLTACALLVEAIEMLPDSKKAEGKEEVVVEKSSDQDEDLYRNVHFAGRTGRDLVDPRERVLSEEELQKIVQNAQKALRSRRNNAPARRTARA